MNIYLDGTRCTVKSNTNIHRLYKKYDGHYFPGPGTGGFFLERIFGGAFGLGTDAIVERAYQALSDEVDAGLYNGQLNIFGFSRGAAAARMLAKRVCDEGGQVHFLGVLDTVGAFGIPVNFFGIPFQKINLFKDMKVGPCVERAAHAMARNETRAAFKNTPMATRDGIVQQGFDGDHGYVGNSDETLAWMIDQFGA